MQIPKFGFMTNPTNDIIKEINRRGEMDFDFVEISFQEPMALPHILRKKKHEIKKTRKKYNLFLLAHTPYWDDLGSLHENIRKAWVNETKLMLDVGNELGLQKMNLHPNFSGYNAKNEKSKQMAIMNNIRSLQEIVDYANHYGIVIVIENNPVPPVKFNEYKQILSAVRKAKITIDIAHAFVEGEMNMILKYIRTFKNRLNHMHFHDNHGNDDEHLPLGEGLIDYKKIVKELKQINYKETITVEVFTPSVLDVKTSMEKLKKLWKS